MSTACSSLAHSCLAKASPAAATRAGIERRSSCLHLLRPTQSPSIPWHRFLYFNVWSTTSPSPSLHRPRSFARAELSTDEVDLLQPSLEPPGGPKLYVGNLSWGCSSQDLAELFQQAGSVEHAEVIYDKDTGRSRGFGFVTMRSMEDANAATAKLNGSEYSGRTLRVNSTNQSQADSPPSPPIWSRVEASNLNKLFVGNLDWGVDDASLGQRFGDHGEVVEARVVLDRETGRSRGFGFVTMSSKEDASEAVNKLNGADFHGRSLRVNLAGSKPPVGGDSV